MTKYVIVSFVQEPEVESFHASEWPLHLTLVGVFFSEKESNELFELIASVCEEHSPFEVEAKSKELFEGAKKDISVTEVEKSENLVHLHGKLVSTLEPYIKLRTPEYNYRGYRPHVTDQKSGAFEVGATFILSSITLLRGEGDSWSVERTCNLPS